MQRGLQLQKIGFCCYNQWWHLWVTHAEVAEWQTRCVQGAVSETDMWVQLPPSAPILPRL